MFPELWKAFDMPTEMYAAAAGNVYDAPGPEEAVVAPEPARGHAVHHRVHQGEQAVRVKVTSLCNGA